MNFLLLNRMNRNPKAFKSLLILLLNFCAFSFLNAQEVTGRDPFFGGDRMDVYFNSASSRAALNNNSDFNCFTVAEGLTATQKAVAYGGDAADYTTDTGTYSSNMMSALSAKTANVISPFLGVNDVVVFRNASLTPDVLNFDIVATVVSVVDYPGEVDVDPNAYLSEKYEGQGITISDEVYNTASLSSFVQPQMSGDTVSYTHLTLPTTSRV